MLVSGICELTILNIMYISTLHIQNRRGAEAPIFGHLSRVDVSVVLDRVVPVPVLLLLPPPVVTEDV